MVGIYLQHIRRYDVAQISQHMDCLVELLLNDVSLSSQNPHIDPLNGGCLHAVIALSQGHMNDRLELALDSARLLLRLKCLFQDSLDVLFLLLLLGLLEQLVGDGLLDLIPEVKILPVFDVAFYELGEFEQQLTVALLGLLVVFQSESVNVAFEQKAARAVYFFLECGEDLQVGLGSEFQFVSVCLFDSRLARVKHALVNDLKNVLEKLVLVQELFDFPQLCNALVWSLKVD